MNNNNFNPEIIKENLTKHIPNMMQKHHVPGLSLAMFKGENILFHLEFGVKNVNTQEKVDKDTIFEGASFTKPLIAYAALKLCQKGLLSLDVPLRTYLDKPYKSDPPLLEKVTLRQVLDHNSGFPFLVEFNEPLSLVCKPGTDYNYSSSAFDYLGFVMNHILHNSLDEYLREIILHPMQMHHSSFIWEPQFEVLSATPHNHRGEAVEKWKPNKVIAGCSIHTTSLDYAKFMMNIFKQAKHSTENDIDMLNTPVKAEDNIYTSLGWGIENTTKGDYIYHAGNSLTFKSLAIAHKESELGIVFMTNGFNGFNLFEKILDISLPDNHRALIDFEEFEGEDEKLKYYGEDYLVYWWKAN